MCPLASQAAGGPRGPPAPGTCRSAALDLGDPRGHTLGSFLQQSATLPTATQTPSSRPRVLNRQPPGRGPGAGLLGRGHPRRELLREFGACGGGGKEAAAGRTEGGGNGNSGALSGDEKASREAGSSLSQETLHQDATQSEGGGQWCPGAACAHTASERGLQPDPGPRQLPPHLRPQPRGLPASGDQGRGQRPWLLRLAPAGPERGSNSRVGQGAPARSLHGTSGYRECPPEPHVKSGYLQGLRRG